ncbi:MAG: porin family protein [Candidatus Thiodiazotropha sp. (ex Gloverina cf. vestifex)]|nr:porin family protein [Candidatus Thiodiazotropha sp. (ex Gloverina cf. vestifex)]
MKFFLSALLMMTCPLALPASDDIFFDSAWLGLSVLDFDYEEFDDRGISLDRERGLLPGLNAGVNAQRGEWLFETRLLWLSGNVDYTSATAASRTDEDILNLELTTGYRIQTTKEQQFYLVAGAGYRKWWRNIHSTATASGLDETYDWSYGLLGLRGEQTLNNQTQLVADLQLTRTINPGINVHFISNFNDVSLNLQEETGYRFRLTLNRQVGESTSFWVAPWYEYWKLGRSNNTALYSNQIQIGSVFEPRSETRNFGINLGVRWRFGNNSSAQF